MVRVLDGIVESPFAGAVGTIAGVREYTDTPNFPGQHSVLFWKDAAVRFLTSTCDWSHSGLLPHGAQNPEEKEP
jgi:hypothetical protein